jgi:hypothetical protein
LERAIEPGLEARQGVAHLAFDLGPRDKGRDAVDDDDVDGVGADESFADLKGLLARVGLGDEEVIDLDANGAGVARVEGVLDVDVGGHAAFFLGFGEDVLGEGGLSGRFWPVELGNPATGNAADAEGEVEGERAGWDRLDLEVFLLAQTHDCTTAELLFDLANREVDGASALFGHYHVTFSLCYC